MRLNARSKSLSVSSQRWLWRQDRDPYVKAAQRDRYRSRSAYKLMEIVAAEGGLRRGARVIDLGAAPGSWSQFIAAQIDAAAFTPTRLIAVDITAMRPIAGVSCLQGDVFDPDLVMQLRSLLDCDRVDVVLSDMAPTISGHHHVDHDRSMNLCDQALEISLAMLDDHGCFVCKVLQGRHEPIFFRRLSDLFMTVKRIKPAASRKDSTELYHLAKQRRP